MIVRGVRTTDQLQALGLPMAHKYDQADVVALVGEDSRGVVVKGSIEPVFVELIDTDPDAGRCARAIKRVKDAVEIEDTEFTAVSMFLFFWPLYLGSVDMVIDGMARGESKLVEAAAELFIRCDFGNDLSKIQADEQRSDAGGHAAN